MVGPTVERGPAAIARLLCEHNHDLRAIPLDGFAGWLAPHLARWGHDSVFGQRARIRDLRRAHLQLRELESAHRRAAAADAASPAFASLAALAERVSRSDRAVAGLAEAIAKSPPPERDRLREKQEQFRAEAESFRAAFEEQVRGNPERQELLRAATKLERCRSQIGLDAEEARLRQLLTARGRGSGRAGDSFEDLALNVTREHIVPELGDPTTVRILRGVTLGAARVEFDQLVVRAPDRGPVDVLAVVEAKRNVNDLAHGFARRQENLVWLTGDPAGPDPAEYRTRTFPTGRFDRETTHKQDGERFVFGPGSFARFTRDPVTGDFFGRHYLITRAGPLWGLSGAALSRISYRVATDKSWDPAELDYMSRLFAWCRGLANPVEAPDVLRLYSAGPDRARQVLVIEAV